MRARRRRNVRRIAVGVAVTVATIGIWGVSRADPDQVPARQLPVGAKHYVASPPSDPAGTPTKKRHAAYRPCSRNHKSRLVIVSIERQHEWACAHHHEVLSTAVTTGASGRRGEATPRGTFAVQGLNRNTRLTTSAGQSFNVKYWIPFHLGIWGFHDASWQKMPFGSKHYVRRGSHGCVHMPLAAIRWLFHWVRYGTPVRIR